MALMTVALLAVAVAPLLANPVAISAATAPTNAVPHSLPAARCERCVVMPIEGKHSLRLSLIATKTAVRRGRDGLGATGPGAKMGLHKHIGMCFI